MSSHVINGKTTHVGHNVHYTDHQGVEHAATITDLDNKNGVHSADLVVLNRHNGHESYLENVPHSTADAPHSWDHIPS